MSSTNPLPMAQVVPRGEKQFSVVIGGHEVGVSKTHFDASLHANVLNRVILDAYKRGCQDTREVAIQTLMEDGL